MIYSKIGRVSCCGGLQCPLLPNPTAAKFTSQGHVHVRTDLQINFLYYPLNTYFLRLLIYIIFIILPGIYSLKISLKCRVSAMQEEKFCPNEIRAHIITRNTKTDSSIKFFVAKILPENRGMKIIWLSIYKVKPKLLDFRCYGNTSNKFHFFRELGKDVRISDHFRLPVSVSATAENLNYLKIFH